MTQIKIPPKNSGRFNSLIASVSERHNRKLPSIPTLARWVKLFNDQNKNKNALLPKSKSERKRFPYEIELIIEDEIEEACLSQRRYNDSYLAAEMFTKTKRIFRYSP